MKVIIVLLIIFKITFSFSQSLEWVRTISGSNTAQNRGVTLGNNSSVNLSGGFRSTQDFDPSANIYNLVSNSNFDVFTTQLDVNGNFNWASSITASSGSEFSYDIKYSSIDNSIVHLAGITGSNVDFDPSANLLLFSSNGNLDIVIRKLDLSGNLVWVKQIGGNGMTIQGK